MQSLLSYLIKIILISAVMYCYYLLLLRNKKFHQYNRFYLLMAVFLPLILPFIPFDFLFTSGRQAIPVIIKRDMVMDTIVVNLHPHYWDAEKILWLVYFITASVLAILFMASLIRIYIIRKKGVILPYRGVSIVKTFTRGTPFSFFNYIFWNPITDIHTPEGQQMFLHELTHVRQLHSLDKLLVNLVQIVFWFNPVFWFVKREINVVHEFLADKESFENADAQRFSQMALQAAYPGFTWPATNNFFYSPLKRRLTMLLKDKQQKVSYFGRIMVLPLTAIIFMFFSVKAEEIKINSGDYKTASLQAVISLPDTTPVEGKIFTRVEKEAQFPGGAAAWQKYLVTTIQQNLTKFTDKDYGTCILKFIVRKDGSVSNVTAITMQGTELANVGIDAVRKGPKWIPAQQNGQYVNAYRLQPITIKNPKKDTTIILEKSSVEKNADITDRKIFVITEKTAEFPGGNNAWQKYITAAIQRNLTKFTDKDYGTCVVRFIVTQDGVVQDVTATTMKGTELAQVAVEAIKNGPHWIPAQQNNRNVNSFRLQPVTLLNDKNSTHEK